ncbi:hypothetical protein SDC9_197156 [bioreactor metagenome]|uniref:Uncharacterized protein n=1 Tax=bioreactor metagenome TaxID=1076179 RepID=A0A645IE10_9ZZZZ
MQHDAADQLDVEVTLAQHPARGLAHDGEGFFEKLVEGFTLGQAVLEFLGLAAKLGVGQGLHLRLKRVDLGDPRVEAFDLAVVRGAEEALEDAQGKSFRIRGRARRRRL